jgi:hypothetical protein
MCRFTKDRLHAEVSSIANRSSPSDNDPELQMRISPPTCIYMKAAEEHAEQKEID